MCHVIEDEFHVLIECPRFINERKRYLPNVLRKKPSMFEFLKLMNCTTDNECRTLGKLCANIQKEHRKFI